MAAPKTAKSAAILIISLRWKGEALALRTVKPGETVLLGDAKGALAPLPEEALGAATLAVADTEGGAHLLVPEGKVASIADLRGVIRLVAGPQRAPLAHGEEARMFFGLFELTASLEKAEPGPRRRRVAAGAWLHIAAVAAIHAFLLAAGARAALASSMADDGTAEVEQMRGYLAAAEQRGAASDKVLSDAGGQHDTKRTNGRSGNGKDAGGERHSGVAGKAGVSASRDKNRHFGANPAADKGTASTVASELEAARDFGMIGLLKSMDQGAFAVDGQAKWGANDPFASAGGLLGRTVGESAGASGLALSGTGEGGGGRGEGIGLGTIGTIGHADGLPGVGTGGTGTSLVGVGFGRGRGFWGREHRMRTTRHWGHGGWYTGRLPAEIIRRVIRANFGRFRGCYQDGLLRNPQLAGRVTTSFVIGRDGAVSSVGDAGTDLPDRAVGNCVRRAFYGLSFPQPEGGIVTVTYPIVFSPE